MSERKSVTFKYKFAEDYNPVYVNGAQGGINPSGEIVANFYLERLPLPNKQEFGISENGTLSGNPVSNDPEDLGHSMVRMVQSGVIMNLATAEAIHSWLGQQIDTVKSIQNHNKK